MASENELLGQFDIVGIPPQPAEVPRIQVTFTVDNQAGPCTASPLYSVSAFRRTLVSSKSRVYSPKDGDLVGLSARRSVARNGQL